LYFYNSGDDVDFRSVFLISKIPKKFSRKISDPVFWKR